MYFFTNYEKLCHNNGKTPNGVAAELGLPSSSVTQWKKGTTPRPKTLAKISEYFNVTQEELLFGIKEKSPAVAGRGMSFTDLTEEEMSILLSYRRADDHTKGIVKYALEPFAEPSKKAAGK